MLLLRATTCPHGPGTKHPSISWQHCRGEGWSDRQVLSLAAQAGRWCRSLGPVTACLSQRMGASIAATTFCTASQVSGPIPSPGMRVISCGLASFTWGT